MFLGMNRKKKKTNKNGHFSTRSKSKSKSKSIGRVACMRRGRVSSPHISSERKRVSSPHISSGRKRVSGPHISSGRNRTVQFASAQRWHPGSSFSQISTPRHGSPRSSEIQNIRRVEKNRIERFAKSFDIKDVGNLETHYKGWSLSKNLKYTKQYAAGEMADVLYMLKYKKRLSEKNTESHNDKILKGVSETKLIKSNFSNHDKDLELLTIYREYMIPRIIYKLISENPSYNELKKHIVLVKHIYTGEISSQKILFVEMTKMTGKDVNEEVFPDPVPICVEVFYIVSSLNRLKIMHGDVKPDNFKFNKKKNKVRIFDFGFSCIVTKNPRDLQYKLKQAFFKNLQCKEKYVGSIGYIFPGILKEYGGKGAITSKFIFLKELYALMMTCYVIITGKLYEMNDYDFLDENFPFPEMGILFHCILQVSTWKDMLDRLKKFGVISPQMSGSDNYHMISSNCYNFLTK